jgi:hypothetical protein
MIIRIARRGFGKYVVLNKKQMAMCFAPRKYEIKEVIAELRSTRQLPLRHGYVSERRFTTLSLMDVLETWLATNGEQVDD